MTTCELCDQPVRAKGLCGRHYKRLQRHGDPELVKRPGPVPNTDRPRATAVASPPAVDADQIRELLDILFEHAVADRHELAKLVDVVIGLRDATGVDWRATLTPHGDHGDIDERNQPIPNAYLGAYLGDEASRYGYRGPIHKLILSNYGKTLEGFPERGKDLQDKRRYWIRQQLHDTAVSAYTLAGHQHLYQARAAAQAAAEHDTDDADTAVVPAKGTRDLVKQITDLMERLVSLGTHSDARRRDPEALAHRVRKAEREELAKEVEDLHEMAEAIMSWASAVTEALEELDTY